MPNTLRLLIVPALLLASCFAAQAEIALPGKTLQAATRAGIQQPAKNAKNILKGIISPDCPHLGKTLRELLTYARVTWPALYRQAIRLRRTGFSQIATRSWLVSAICHQEGA
jgi:hypothetical protein